MNIPPREDKESCTYYLGIGVILHLPTSVRSFPLINTTRKIPSTPKTSRSIYAKADDKVHLILCNGRRHIGGGHSEIVGPDSVTCSP